MAKLVTGASLAVVGVLVGALAATSAERLAGPINDAVLISRAKSAVKRMFLHPELIRFESESTRIVEHENERFVCGWLNLGPSGQNGTYRHPRRAFSYRERSEDGRAYVLADYSPSEISRMRDPHKPCGIGGAWIQGWPKRRLQKYHGGPFSEPTDCRQSAFAITLWTCTQYPCMWSPLGLPPWGLHS
jgi:hypothetical protein